MTQRFPSLSRSSLIAVAAVLAPYAVLMALVPPTGEFPYLDDFDYAATVRHLIETGRLKLSDWPAMTLVGHVLWGSLFCLPAGCSFVALRLSMIVLSAAASLAIYAWFRKFGHPRWAAVLAAWTFALNPWTVQMEYTFMTDLSGTALGALLILLSWRLVDQPLWKWSLFGLTGGMAYLFRETAAVPFVVMVGLSVLLSLRDDVDRKEIAAMLAPAAVLYGLYQLWLNKYHGVPWNRLTPQLALGDLDERFGRLLFQLNGLGLYLLPLALLTLPMLFRSGRWRQVLAIAAALALGSWAGTGEVPSPLRGDSFSVDAPPSGTTGRTPAFAAWRVATTLTGLLSISCLGSLVWNACAPRSPSPRLRMPWDLLPLLSLGATIGILLCTRVAFERYLLPMIPMGIMTVAVFLDPEMLPRGALRIPAVAAATLMGLFSLIGLQDWMVRSRVFWETLTAVNQVGIEPAMIDGGIAYGGEYRFTPSYRGETHQGPYFATLTPDQLELAIIGLSPWTDVSKRPIRVGFGEVPGYQVMAEISYRTWRRNGHVLVGRRLDVTPSELGDDFLKWAARHSPTDSEN